MTDARSRTVVFVCHCLLNQNAKVEPLAHYPGAFEPLVRRLLDAGVGIAQLPCPELAHHGVARPLGSDTVEQYDTPGYREVCRAIAAQTVGQVGAYQREGYPVACVLGVEGSPSCSVGQKPVLENDERITVPGSGLLIEALQRAMAEVGTDVPIVGIPESDEVGDIGAALQSVAAMLE